MAQFDVYEDKSSPGLLLDCQADLLSHLDTRLVAPLLAPEDAPKPARRLNPTFDIDGAPYVLVTQFAGAMERRELGPQRASLAEHRSEIIAALDVLLTGI